MCVLINQIIKLEKLDLNQTLARACLCYRLVGWNVDIQYIIILLKEKKKYPWHPFHGSHKNLYTNLKSMTYVKAPCGSKATCWYTSPTANNNQKIIKLLSLENSQVIDIIGCGVWDRIYTSSNLGKVRDPDRRRAFLLPFLQTAQNFPFPIKHPPIPAQQKTFSYFFLILGACLVEGPTQPDHLRPKSSVGSQVRV